MMMMTVMVPVVIDVDDYEIRLPDRDLICHNHDDHSDV